MLSCGDASWQTKISMINKEDVMCGARAWQRIYCADLPRSEACKALLEQELTYATQTATEIGLQF
eukprot:scaffold175278_cov26-Prasinocladus_malaysianus.AAC.2